ncbi:MAG: SDR family NAD(P)-dependent oxidoreductase [Pseudomonadales bacterium]|nr:SDR family NAD(P)-dependent oxidoreductase [Pseudomonadales bacterium]
MSEVRNPQLQQRLVRAMKIIDRMQKKIDRLESGSDKIGIDKAIHSRSDSNVEPVAVIGIGCRFPGADNPHQFWQNLLNGVDAIGEVPADRWNAQQYHHDDPDHAGTIVTKNGGFVGNLDTFDAGFFNISPKEAATLDPQQRLLLEVAWEALEDAGLTLAACRNKKVGVFVGISSNDYSQQLLSRPALDQDAYVATGNAHSAAAGRISFAFGFDGPSMVVDTACSSSLVAVHLACQSLRSGECDIALVGGVNRILNPDGSLIFSRAHMLANDGRCKVFDAAADGFCRAEGCGVVVLQRAKDAASANAKSKAEILGSAVNQDGRSSGLTVPNGPAQQRVIREALYKSGLTPEDIDYIEAHGTGTALGDPIEIGALKAVFDQSQRLLVGSVKANVGHMEAAAGVGGLIKLVLTLQHQQLPGQINFNSANPNIDFGVNKAGEPLIQVCDETQTWPTHRRNNSTYQRSAGGVSSFGFAGTNAHVVVQSSNDQAYADTSDVIHASNHGTDLLCLSARSPEALLELAQRYKTLLQQSLNNEQDTQKVWQNICFSALQHRDQFSHRLAIVAENTEQAIFALADRISDLSSWIESTVIKSKVIVSTGIEGSAKEGTAKESSAKEASPYAGFNSVLNAGQRKIAFLYTGQGAQYYQMARDLYVSEPIFQAAIQRCDRWLNKHEKWSLVELLYKEGSLADQQEKPVNQSLDQTQFAQPALFAIGFALTKLWDAWGIKPAAVLGHSIGEFAAAVAAGVYDWETGLCLAAARGRLMQALPANTLSTNTLSANDSGAMAAVMAAKADVEVLLSKHNYSSVVVAADNAPSVCVLSGLGSELTACCHWLKEQGIPSTRLTVSHAFHSPLVAGMCEAFSQVLAKQKFANSNVAVYSTLTGNKLAYDQVMDEQYWLDHVREPVLFRPALQALIDDGFDAVIELGPQSHLIPLAKRFGTETKVPLWLPSLRRSVPNRKTMADALATLYLAGCDLKPANIKQSIALPLYPFQRQRHWYKQSSDHHLSYSQTSKVAPLFGNALGLASSDKQYYEFYLDSVAMGWPSDHQVFDITVLPAAGFIEIGLQLADHLKSDKKHSAEKIYTLKNIDFHQALTLTEPRIIQTVVENGLDKATADLEFRIFSKAIEGNTWELHATGTLLSSSDTQSATLTNKPKQMADDVRLLLSNSDSTSELSPELCYQRLATQGVTYGDDFRAIEKIALDKAANRVVSRLSIPDSVNTRGYALHPVLLDAALQSIAALFLDDANIDQTYLPAAVADFTFFAPVESRSQSTSDCWCLLQATPGEHWLTVDLTLFHDDGTPFAALKGLQLRPASVNQLRGVRKSDCLYQVSYQQQPDLATIQLAAPELLHQSIYPTYSQQINQEVNQQYLQLLAKLEPLASELAHRIIIDVCGTNEGDDIAELAAKAKIIASQQPLFAGVLNLAKLNTAQTPISLDAIISQLQSLQNEYPQAHAELTLLQRSAVGMKDVLTGIAQPLEILFPDGDTDLLTALYESSPGAQLMNGVAAQVLSAAVDKAVAADASQSLKTLRVLEVGAGTGGTSAYLLPVIQSSLNADSSGSTQFQYCFTDLSPTLLKLAEARFATQKDLLTLDFKRLDISQPVGAQGFEHGTVDILIAANVIHATSDLSESLRQCAELLVPGGQLILLEITRQLAFLDLIFGLTEGWWNFQDERRAQQHPLISSQQWQQRLTESGFDAVATLTRGYCGDSKHGDASRQTPELPQSVMVARKAIPALPRILVIHDSHSAFANHLTTHCEAYHCKLPNTVQDAKHSLKAFLKDNADQSSEIVFYADQPENLLYLVQALADVSQGFQRSGARCSLKVLTCGAIGPEGSVTHPLMSTLSGISRVISLEHPEWHCLHVDLDPAESETNQAETLVGLLSTSHKRGEESSLCIRDGRYWLPRLAPANFVSGHGNEVNLKGAHRQLIQKETGSIDSLSYEAVTSTEQSVTSIEQRVTVELAAHEVQIQVHAAGLNFIDVLDALDILPFERGWLGVECAGIVTDVGAEVSGFSIGDRVMALAPGSFQDVVRVDARWVVPVPANLSMQAAAGIPAAFLTATETLLQAAQLQPGERVLIHAASGGTGMAALQVALLQGAEVYATASPAKWQQVKAQGAQHVFNSRDLDFADEINALGGVDVVLNSLSGDFIEASVRCLNTKGRFIEIGKRDVWSHEQMYAARPDIEYQCVDLMMLAHSEPDRIKGLFNRMQPHFDDGALKPSPYQCFPVKQAAVAFKTMQRTAHIGKLVLTFDIPAKPIQPKGCYLVTGGLGGLGMLTVRWLLAQGARHILLVSRRQLDSAQQQVLENWKQEFSPSNANNTVNIHVESLDVTDSNAVTTLFHRFGKDLPHLKGIFHGAGVLDDGVLQQLDWSRMNRVLSPKVEGAWLMHKLSLELSAQSPSAGLDYFVLYSSAASLLGSPGQASHVAANRFLDSLALYRRQLGLAGLSINWGPWSEIGSAAGESTLKQMHARGVDDFDPEEGMALFDQLVTNHQSGQIGAVKIRWDDVPGMIKTDPYYSSIFNNPVSVDGNDLRKVSTNASDVIASDFKAKGVTINPEWQKLASKSNKQRQVTVVRLLQEELASVLALGSGQLPQPDLGFFDMGLDSLMIVELRNRLTKQCGVTLSSSSIFEYPNIRALADHLIRLLVAEKASESVPETDLGTISEAVSKIEPHKDTEEPPTSAADSVPLNQSVDSTSSDNQSTTEIDAAIAEELAAIDALLARD